MLCNVCPVFRLDPPAPADLGIVTGSTLNHWPFPARHLHEGYAYLLTHPGTPCVFWDHWVATDGLGDTITKLLLVRKQHGLSARSKVRLLIQPCCLPYWPSAVEMCVAACYDEIMHGQVAATGVDAEAATA